MVSWRLLVLSVTMTRTTKVARRLLCHDLDEGRGAKYGPSEYRIHQSQRHFIPIAS